ncbi:inositol monophosphatase [Nocardia cyriacigeorgica]|uniref:inositol-phosphate phosphatase n=1 Tax=Nocardia cyriacigeorgica TaxID=135487 RepID=A0ABX0CPK5_9NOCA|nr:inositol monophosphatase [Nocardia cyriacigeorgica]NEW41437.1 inositol monophosphatase [Nocardia cyriacigeorgica]NEW51948.1 inositol monophosphatase [Nocardia cyriacigeorgica]NEW55742.1 inositol monophosphatase [Nocardia cyriacigeorgica]
MTVPNPDPAALLPIAAEVLDAAAVRFVDGLGAPSAVDKGHNDFATELDLELERTISARLHQLTGIEVHGEEFGGPQLTSGTAWVLDPIDGTFNYSSGHPLSGMLLALVRDGEPVLGLTWLPVLGRRYAAVAGGPVLLDGVPQPPLPTGTLAEAMIGFGAFNVDSAGRIPGRFRFDLLGALSRLSSRVRMHGSTGIDLAFTASGALGGAIVFGHHPWDNAAGVALVRAAGGVVTDLAGAPWHIESGSVLAAAPGVHAELLEMIGAVSAETEPTAAGGGREG